jgi:VIT1/CCC1 family predicted Fe2+/Mn2+ transporter
LQALCRLCHACQKNILSRCAELLQLLSRRNARTARKTHSVRWPCLLVFLSTFPPVIPFLLWGDVQTALRISNAVAIVTLFGCSYAYALGTGLRPWITGLVMVAIGFALVAVAVALGG